jgi:hypothetical protein
MASNGFELFFPLFCQNLNRKFNRAEYTQTSLMWMRCSLGQTWDGSTCAGEVATYNWEEALKTPNDFSYEGYSDWRVPTSRELITLMYCSSGLTKMWTDIFSISGHDGCDGEYTIPTIKTDVFLNTPSHRFLSSSSSPYFKSRAWFVHFGYDNGNGEVKGDGSAVRLVRSGQ